MNEEQIQKIQDEILGGIDKELEQDKEVREIAEEIAFNLHKSKKTQFMVADRLYLFQYGTYINKDTNNNCIIIYVTDIEIANKAKVGDYSPFVVNSEVDNDFSLEENLQATVEAFINLSKNTRDFSHEINWIK